MVGSGWIGSGRVNFTNKFGRLKLEISFYPKSLRPFLRILSVVDYSDIYKLYMQNKLLVRYAGMSLSLRFARDKYTHLQLAEVLHLCFQHHSKRLNDVQLYVHKYCILNIFLQEFIDLANENFSNSGGILKRLINKSSSTKQHRNILTFFHTCIHIILKISDSLTKRKFRDTKKLCFKIVSLESHRKFSESCLINDLLPTYKNIYMYTHVSEMYIITIHHMSLHIYYIYIFINDIFFF